MVRKKKADLSARVNQTIRAVENQTPTQVAVQFNKIKVLEPKPLCGVWNVKTLENFIFYLEQYFWVTNTATKKAKVTLATMHLVEDAKLC